MNPEETHKAKFDVDPDDKLAARSVLSILNQFANRVLPNLNDLRRVLDHLQIQSWNECNDEIKFLDEEIDLESSDGHDRVVLLLSSLVGFTSYCRDVMFDAMDDRSISRLEALIP
uniref:Uncharacterized protein n=1 Tax=Nelumbo nucifera TaxID=4432 RepID=A0A822XVW4_NELNU|nr:TPA_asm: hypothetical protein HUJ06_024599 [Nelumbo nucifera]